MAMLTDACWVGHFCVETDIFLSNECHNFDSIIIHVFLAYVKK